MGRCCCYHFHSNECIFTGKQPKEIRKSDFHKKYHEKSNKCKCRYEQCHIHNKNCSIALEIQNDPMKKKYKIDKFNDIVKICCCDTNVAHNEISKIKIWSRQNDKSDEKNLEDNKPVNIFKYNIRGKIQINENVCTDFIAKKYYSIIGRKVLVRNIFKCIAENRNHNFIILLYGEKGLHKRDFAEATCVYLLERRIIHE